ncbi:EAL domain-containing protein [Actinomycetes bacterium KLBMP 9759]
MVAPRSLTEPAVRRTPGAVNGITDERSAQADRIARLSVRWATLAPPGSPVVISRLATALRRLAATLRAEPFWPLAARAIGAELLTSGLCGDPSDPVQHAEDVLPRTLALLRKEAPSALGIVDEEGERRLACVLDEMAAGFAKALSGRRVPARVVRVPLQAVKDATDELVLDHWYYRAGYEQSGVGIGIIGLDGQVLDFNPALRKLLGIAGQLDQPRPFSDFVHPDDLADVLERFGRVGKGDPDVLQLDMRLVRQNGDIVWVHVSVSPIRGADGTPSHITAFVADISERHQLRARLRQATSQDQLTRLPSQALTEQWLHHAFADGAVARVGICALDLDGFDAVVDEYGDDVADRLLLGVVGRLQLAAGDHLVCRTGCDEFAVLIGDPASVTDVCHIADRLQAALATPFVIGGYTVGITASIGVAESATAGGSAAELVRSADIAMSWAKALGGARRVVFDHERDTAEAARFALVSGLRPAIERGEFRLAYQPLVGLDGGRLRGVEALVRWQHPEQGLIGPAKFIELAEQSGAIIPLGRWILETACRQAASWWQVLGPDTPYVSVNVSPVQLNEPGWVSIVEDVLAETGLPAHRLQLEITEQAVLGDDETALDALTELRAAGVRLALDDFGTGYSSLAWLRRLPVHALKIDGSFIEGLRKPEPDTVDIAIVRALVEMAHALGLEVTAEWVETVVQSERLAELGCDTGQGHWFGDAGPGEWVPELFRRSIGA